MGSFTAVPGICVQLQRVYDNYLKIRLFQEAKNKGNVYPARFLPYLTFLTGDLFLMCSFLSLQFFQCHSIVITTEWTLMTILLTIKSI